MKRIASVLKEIDFTNMYINLCNKFSAVDEGNNFTRQQIHNAISKIDFDLKYSSKEKLFYQDYLINDWNIRLIVPYKYGFIDCSYTMINDENRFGGSFAELCEMVDVNFEKKIQYKFPVATSLITLNEILSVINKLNKIFLEKFKEKMAND